MKLPRDLSGEKLASLLTRYAYHETRREGSHIRLTAERSGKEHHLTIPVHNPIKVGTLNGIINELASNLEMNKQELIKQLFY
jgi:predicted RNA binding protein YcfA (HicA-like mRNA interferase family)